MEFRSRSMHLCRMAPPADLHLSPHSGAKCQSSSPRPWSSRGREAGSADCQAEHGLSSLDSWLWAALEFCRVSVGLGDVEATPGLDNKDEEMLVLTRSDDLSRTYEEDSQSPPDHLTNKDDPRINSGPAFTETRTSVIATGSRTITITSAVSSQSCDADATALNPSPTITAWEAGWNVTNAIQGIFVLGLPFALVKSGFAGLVLLVLSAWVCNHTGRILVACLYEEQQSELPGPGSKVRVRVRHSYQDVVEACCKGLWPRLGGWTVNVAQVIELLMTCTLYLVVSTSLLSDTLSEAAVPRSACSLLSLLLLLPCLLLTDLRPVSTLSLLCSLAHILISLMVMLHCLSLSSRWSWSSLALPVDPEDFLVAVGVIIFSYTSQIFLPPLEGSMEDRGRFNAMLGWSHGAACIMKTMFALLAVLTWGAETSEVITDNLPPDLRPLVNLCLLVKALLSFPLPFYSAAEILQSCLQRDLLFSYKHGGRGVSRAALLVRGALLMMSYLLALLVPRFSLLMGLTGSVTGAAMTLILPCLCHLRLRWGRLAARERLVDGGILSLGVVCSVSGLMCSARRLLQGL